MSSPRCAHACAGAGGVRGSARSEQLPAFLECNADCVTAVPPAGAFDPRKDYGEDAFSYRHREVIVLEPVQFGVALTMKNMEDSGALWLRTALSIEVTGDSFDVFVAQQPIIHIPLDYEGKLDPGHTRNRNYEFPVFRRR